MGDAWEMVLDGSGSAKANASAYPSAWRNPPRRKDPRPESRAPPSIHSFDVFESFCSIIFVFESGGGGKGRVGGRDSHRRPTVSTSTGDSRQNAAITSN